MFMNKNLMFNLVFVAMIACFAFAMGVYSQTNNNSTEVEGVMMEGDCYFDDVDDTLPCYFMKK